MAGVTEAGAASGAHLPTHPTPTPPAITETPVAPAAGGAGDTSRLDSQSGTNTGAYPDGAPAQAGVAPTDTPEQAAQAEVVAATRAERIKHLKEMTYAQNDPCPPKSMSLEQKADPIRFVESHVADLDKQLLFLRQKINRLPKDDQNDNDDQKKLRAEYKQEAQHLQDELDAAVERRKDLGNAQGWLTRMTQSGTFAAVTGIGGLLTGLVFLPQAFAGMGGGKHTSQDAADPSTQLPNSSMQSPDPSTMQQSKLPSPPPSYTSYAPQPIVYNPYPSGMGG